MKNIIRVLILLSIPAFGQFVPSPIGGYVSNGSGGWVPLASTSSFGPISYTPTPYGLYAYNTSLGQWVPCTTSTCGSGGGGGGTPGGSDTQVQFNDAGSFGGNAAFTFVKATGVVTAAGYATGSATQGFLTLIQNANAAPAQPANSYELLAPQSGLATSYQNIVPIAAPVSNNSVMASPNGGGQMTWIVPPSLAVSNTFTANQQITSGSTSGAALALTNTSTSNLAIITMHSQGGQTWEFGAGGTNFTNGNFYFKNDTNGNVSQTFTPLSYGIVQGGIYGWANSTSDAGQPFDTGFSRTAAGVIGVGTGSANSVAGQVAASGYRAAGTIFSVAGCGSSTGLTGGATGGTFVGGSATCTPVITMGATAPHGYSCNITDQTTSTAAFRQTANNQTTATFTAGGTVGSTDTIVFWCGMF